MSSFVGQQVHILHPYLFKKGHLPQRIWLKICVWNPKHLLDLKTSTGKWEIFNPKISLRLEVSVVPNRPTTELNKPFEARGLLL